MSTQKYPHLFSPIVLGNRLFRNRIFASPTGYQNVNGDGYLNEGAAAYYGRKAQGGAASVATFEGIVDGEFGRGGDRHIALDTPNVDSCLARVAHGITDHGAVATLELQHAGMFANRALAMFGAVATGPAYGPVECEVAGRTVMAMDEAIIERTIKKFVDGAVLGARVGFGMVLIHAGHGWGLHQFLSPLINTRKDKWGGAPIENRARILIEIIDGIHKALGKGFPVEVRISGSECYDGGYGIETGIEIAQAIDGHADLIHVSAGNHEVAEVFAVTHPSMFLDDGVNVKYAAEIKKHVKTPVAAIGALSDPELMEEIIASGQADVVEMGRQFMADPDFPKKFRSGNEANTRRCLRCLSCFSNELTHGEPYCAINPESGREDFFRFMQPPATKKKVLVVGGGVGGMQAALTAADRGHEVILAEKSDRLGGVLLCEEEVSFKKKLDFYLKQQARLVGEANIDVRLNTTVDAAYAEGVGADVVIAALGAEPVKPPIPGIDGSNVFSAQTAYKSIDQLGQNVVVIGAGLVGVELALHLKSLGINAQCIEMLDHISDGGNFLHIDGVNNELKRLDVSISFKTAVKEIKPNAVVVEHEGETREIPADSIVYAVGQKPLRDEALALNFTAPEFYVVGDSVSPRNITEANTEARFAALDIGQAF